MRSNIIVRQTVLLLCVLSAAGSATAAAPKGKVLENLRLTLPPVCYAAVGVPMSIYYDNVVLTETPERYRFEVKCDLGQAEQRRWTVTPKATDVGDHPIAITVANGAGQTVARGKTVLHVAPSNAGEGRSIRLLIIGDSLTHATTYSNQIAKLLSGPGNPAWAMLGTHRPASAAEGVTHEGYGGWTWARFGTYYDPKAENKSGRRNTSPFVFAGPDGKSVLDLPRYFDGSCGGRRPDIVTFLLGINDCFRLKADDGAATEAGITAMFAQAQVVVDAFRKAAPEAELGICLTTPPNARESGFEANYKGAYHRWGWKRVQHRLVERQLTYFGGKESQRIFVVPTELNLDPVDGYPTNNGVHPNAVGYNQIGDSIYSWVKWRLESRR